MTPTHMFSFEYGRIFKNTYLEEHLWTATSVSSWQIWLKRSSNTSEFYTSKSYSFYLQEAVEKSTVPNILAVSAAGIFMDTETDKTCFSGFLYRWSPENEIACLNTFAEKGFNGKIWLLQNHFLLWAGQTCSYTSGNGHFNCSFVTDSWKKSVIRTNNQARSCPLVLYKTFYKKTLL